jgi:hypothetical protein
LEISEAVVVVVAFASSFRKERQSEQLLFFSLFPLPSFFCSLLLHFVCALVFCVLVAGSFQINPVVVALGAFFFPLKEPSYERLSCWV